MKNLEVGDLVMCTVDRIVGVLVFVKIDGNGEGSIIISEVATGRIRNLKDYVVPKKRIVCKVLRILGDRIDLSLRRVTQKERKQIIDQYKQEKSYENILKKILGEKAEKILKQITEKERLYDFLEETKQNPLNLEKIIGKQDTEKLLKIVNAQKQKKAIIKKEIFLTTTEPNGLELIKSILGKIESVEIKYICAGKYSIKMQSIDLKKTDMKLKEILVNLEKQAKKQNIKFSIKEK